VLSVLHTAKEHDLSIATLIDIAEDLEPEPKESFNFMNGEMLVEVLHDAVRYEVVYDKMTSGKNRVLGVFHKGINFTLNLNSAVLLRIEEIINPEPEPEIPPEKERREAAGVAP